MELFNLRKVYVQELIEQAKHNERIICLDSDSKESSMLESFAEQFPERSFSIGIAEQNMVTMAGGMATMGLIPFVNSYGIFIGMRALEQLRNSIAYPNLNVKFVLTHHGLDSGSDGVTHQLTEDISILRPIPNIKLLQPADSIEMKQMTDFAIRTEGPIVIKAGKSPVPNINDVNFRWEYGSPALIADGEKVTIIAVGVMVARALKARDKIKEKLGFYPQVINLSSLTDVSVEKLLKHTSNTKLIVTFEDHSIYGGLGGIIAEIFSEYKPTKVVRVGLKRTFAESGDPEQLYERYDMNEDFLVKSVKNNL